MQNGLSPWFSENYGCLLPAFVDFPPGFQRIMAVYYSHLLTFPLVFREFWLFITRIY